MAELPHSINQNMVITGCPTEKNLAMLENIVAASSNPGDLVLDAFCGSGTTMQAAYNLDRRWIGIEREEEAICVVLKRLNNGSEKMGDFVTDKAAKAYKTHELPDEKNFVQSLFGICPFQFLVASDKLDQAKASFKVKVPPETKHSEDVKRHILLKNGVRYLVMLSETSRGKKMFAAFLRRFRKDRGTCGARIILSVAIGNDAAESFYRSVGFSEIAKQMEMKVEKGKA